ncbi:isoprenylcysteine carboxylmethyltransferase family protein [Candidatus Woesearchaeota archaeon]|nr:isoprenylcysteine carboxylmethyltransferase family protein [Candidatus Woesearchaeota archaeon]
MVRAAQRRATREITANSVKEDSQLIQNEGASRQIYVWSSTAALIIGMGETVYDISDGSLERPLCTLAGLGVIYVGERLIRTAQKQLRSHAKNVKGDFAIAGIKDNELYSIVRNPIYTGFLVADIGSIALSPSYIVMGAAGVAALALGETVYAEEKRLEARFGDAYREYCQQVPRFIPSFSTLGNTYASFLLQHPRLAGVIGGIERLCT